MAILNLVPLGFVAHAASSQTVGIFDHLVAVLLIGLLAFAHRGGSLATATHAGIALGGAFFLYLFVSGGVGGTGHLWFLTYPLFASFLLGSRRGAAASLLFLIPATIFLLLDTSNYPAFHQYSHHFSIRFLPAYLVVFAYSYAFERMRESGHARVMTKNAELAAAIELLREKETALEQAQERLEQRVGERTAELRCANEELSREVVMRRRTEEDLQDERRRFATVLDSIEANVYVADMDTHEILFVNRRMQDAFGEDLVGKPCWEALRENELPGPEGPNQKLLDANGVPRGMVTWEGWSAVTKRWYLYHDQAIRWIDGRTVRLQVGTDVTKRRAAEEENARLQLELLQAQKMEAIGTLAGGVAHDLNNILSGVVGFPDLILMELPEDSPLQKPIRSIRQSGEKCARIVQDMLTLSRRGTVRAQLITPADVVDQYFESPEYEHLQARYPEVHVEHRSPSGASPLVCGSAHQLSKTLMNLVVNAFEAMPSGGKLRVETTLRDLGRPIRGFMTIPEGRYVVLRVADTGTGIPAGQMSRIFEPFFTTKTMGRSGTGLGMAVVWATVQDHQGYLDVRSREGQGTTIEVYLPVADVPASEDTAPRAPAHLRGRGESVLVVDDMQEQRDLMSMILSRLGYAVDVVSSGEEALTYLRANRPDLLVLDMVMEGGIDGLDTYRGAIGIHPGQRAIIVSGHADSERVEEARRLGVAAYLRKPYLVGELGEAVRGALREKSEECVAV